MGEIILSIWESERLSDISKCPTFIFCNHFYLEDKKKEKTKLENNFDVVFSPFNSLPGTVQLIKLHLLTVLFDPNLTLYDPIWPMLNSEKAKKATEFQSIKMLWSTHLIRMV